MERGIETDKDEEVNGLVSDEGCEELLQCDLNELHRIDNETLKMFLEKGCGHSLNKGKPCFNHFPETHYHEMHNNLAIN